MNIDKEKRHIPSPNEEAGRIDHELHFLLQTVQDLEKVINTNV